MLGDVREELVDLWPSVERAVVLARWHIIGRVAGGDCEELVTQPPGRSRVPRQSAALRAIIERVRGMAEQTPALGTVLARDRRHRVFERYVGFPDLFSDDQWAVLCLYYDEGLSDGQIASVLGRSRSAINGLRTRAEQIMEVREQAERKEFFEAMRNQLDPAYKNAPAHG